MTETAQELTTLTPIGLHDYVLETVAARRFPRGERAADLGAGPGALSARLASAGWDVLAADLNAGAYRAGLPFRQIDFNQPDFAAQLGAGSFTLVTAVEVIEHVESPIGFLRNIGRLLKPGGAAIVTTPNVDSTPARVKFFLRGKIRMMDEIGEPTHISPIFWDLFNRQYLKLAGVELIDHHNYPKRGYQMTRAGLSQAIQVLGWFLPGPCAYGDNHVFILGPPPAKHDGNGR